MPKLVWKYTTYIRAPYIPLKNKSTMKKLLFLLCNLDTILWLNRTESKFSFIRSFFNARKFCLSLLTIFYWQAIIFCLPMYKGNRIVASMERRKEILWKNTSLNENKSLTIKYLTTVKMTDGVNTNFYNKIQALVTKRGRLTKALVKVVAKAWLQFKLKLLHISKGLSLISVGQSSLFSAYL